MSLEYGNFDDCDFNGEYISERLTFEQQVDAETSRRNSQGDPITRENVRELLKQQINQQPQM